MVAITGSAGVGKTRIVQEVYETLAADQTYWPPSLIDGSGPLLSRQRKRVAPRQTHAVGGGEMPYLWLGVGCERGGGEPSDDVADLRAVIRQHLPSMFPETTSAAAELGEAAVDEALETAGGLLLEETLKAGVPGLGVVIAAVKVASEKRLERARRREAEAVERSVRTIDPTLNRAAELVEDLCRVQAARPELPIVLVVEDAHDASPALLDALHAMTAPDGQLKIRILVVTLAWGTEVIGDAIEHIPLGPLPDDDLADLVRHLAPGTSDPVARAFADRAQGNPLLLQLTLENKVVRDASAAGPIRLAVDQIAQLPATVPDALQTLWNQLDHTIQDVLCTAALQGPRFSRELVAKTSALYPRPDADTLIEQAARDRGWVRPIDGRYHEFVEQLHYELAIQHLSESTLPAQRVEAAAQLCVAIRELAAGMEVHELPALWAIHLRLAAELVSEGHADAIDLQAAFLSASALVRRYTGRENADRFITLLHALDDPIDDDWAAGDESLLLYAADYPHLVLERTGGDGEIPTPIGLAILRAAALVRLDDRASAAKILEEVVARRPAGSRGQARARRRLLASLLDLGEVEAALAHARTLIEATTSEDVRGLVALDLAGQFGRAGFREAKDELLAEGGTAARAQQLAASGQLVEALELVPPDGSHFTRLDRVHLAALADDSEAAFEELEAARRADPGDDPGLVDLYELDLLVRLGEDRAGQGAVDLVRDHPQQLIDHESEGWAPLETCLWAALGHGRLEELMNHIEPLIADRYTADRLFAFLETINDWGADEEAEVLAKRLQELGAIRSDADAWRTTKTALNSAMTRGDWDLAVRHLDQLIAKIPKEAMRAQALLQKAGFLLSARRFEEAIALLDELLKTRALTWDQRQLARFRRLLARFGQGQYHAVIAAARDPAFRVYPDYAAGVRIAEALALLRTGRTTGVPGLLDQAEAAAFDRDDLRMLARARKELETARVQHLLRAIFPDRR